MSRLFNYAELEVPDFLKISMTEYGRPLGRVGQGWRSDLGIGSGPGG
jgi:hypothetical protein